MAVQRVAHLSDFHIAAKHRTSNKPVAGLRTRLVSPLRALDPDARMARFERAINEARNAGAEHFILSGDLTETGHVQEFEAFAEALDRLDLPPDDVTLVPGNHDCYARPDAFQVAAQGVLAKWTVVGGPNRVVDLDTVWLLPIDVTCYQSVARATGLFKAELVPPLRVMLMEARRRGVPVVIVQHHPPFPRPWWLQPIDGLVGWELLWDLLKVNERAQVVFGHLHKSIDGPPCEPGAPSRFLGAPAVVDGVHEAYYRVYDVGTDGLTPAPWPDPAHASVKTWTELGG